LNPTSSAAARYSLCILSFSPSPPFLNIKQSRRRQPVTGVFSPGQSLAEGKIAPTLLYLSLSLGSPFPFLSRRRAAPLPPPQRPERAATIQSIRRRGTCCPFTFSFHFFFIHFSVNGRGPAICNLQGQWTAR
jgi:hypothetical protein